MAAVFFCDLLSNKAFRVALSAIPAANALSSLSRISRISSLSVSVDYFSTSLLTRYIR